MQKNQKIKNKKMKRITCFFYTNETYLPIADLSINEFNKFSKDIEIEKILVSNKFPKKDKLKYKKFKKGDANIELKN
jgi:hypothetical protein